MKDQFVTKKILNWYDLNKRSLPWRKNVSPTKKQYFTLVSEFMLQQTQVATVIPYFNRFIKNIPNLSSLAKTSDKKLYKLWEGLGYYSRARNLKKTSIKLIKEFNGQLPKDIEKLKSQLKEIPSMAGLELASNVSTKQPYFYGNEISKYKVAVF